MRIAIVSSPRSGNTWLRRILVNGLELEEIAVHNYLEVSRLPDQCVLQVHWYREPNFQRFLTDNGFKVITLARHPLDVLLSVLHFIKYEPQTARWLEGNCRLPEELRGCGPCSHLFREYALSFGCENLLSASYQWNHDDAALRVKYEDLVLDTAFELERISNFIGISAQPLKNALKVTALESFQALPNRHGWQGRPGLWRELIPYNIANEIYSRHITVFRALGYEVEPNSLTYDGAERRWLELAR
ncbi:MAG: sulfotransferase domain-containing protein [Novosphingobium sp.]|jgi:hypothetical protein|nr:sulfotransferase domain-containing protein [Novosphingobium sp.]